MNKRLLAFLGVAALVVTLGAGCGKGGESGGGGGFFSSVRDAFDRSVSLRCDYTDGSGQTTSNYIKNKMIYTETGGVGDVPKVYGLFRTDGIYLWDEKSGSGIVMNTAKLKDSPMDMDGNKIESVDDLITVLEAQKDKCHAESVPDSYFEVPKNVNFQKLGFE